MPIIQLSTETTRQLQSSLVITTPLSVIKELVENALDAQATSVEVLISSNTVDRIEVRDNGIGISSEDFGLLGRHGHTSKLRTFEELKLIGGSSLGFRGQALASIKAVAKINITTRTSEDTVATTIHLSKQGGIEKQQRTSAPRGTRVIVSSMFENLLVRKQVAVKEANKTFDHVKKLLAAYAFARPEVKLGLRVLSDPKWNWSYSPQPTSGVLEAVLQVFGAEIASHCQWHLENSSPPEEVQDTPRSVGEEVDSSKNLGFCIQALLPSPCADMSKLSKGAFISVDSRPVSTNRGTMKKLLSMFRSAFAKSALSSGNKTPSNLFMQMNVSCPPGSYDPNVEPSKDELIFTNEETVLSLFQSLCEKVYSPVATSSSALSRDIDARARGHAVAQLDSNEAAPHGANASFESIFHPGSQNPGLDTPREGQNREHRSGNPPQTQPNPEKIQIAKNSRRCTSDATECSASRWVVNIGGPVDSPSDDEEDDSSQSSVMITHQSSEAPVTQQGEIQEDMPSGSMEGLNPWSIAKIGGARGTQPSWNSDVQQHRVSALGQVTWNTEEDLPVLRPPCMSSDEQDASYTINSDFRLASLVGVPGGARRSPKPLKPTRTTTSHTARQSRRTFGGTSYESETTRPLTERKGRKRGGGRRVGDELNLFHDDPSESHHQSRHSLLKPNINILSGWEAINRPIDGATTPEATFATVTWHDRHHSAREVGSHGTDHATDWPSEHRHQNKHGRQESSTRWRNTLPVTQSYTSVNGPELPLIQQPPQTRLSVDDPRCYLLRRQKSSAVREKEGRPGQPRRIKTDLLPLEAVSSNFSTQTLVLDMHIDCKELLKSYQRLALGDKLTLRDAPSEHTEGGIKLSDVDYVEQVVKDVVSRWVEAHGGARDDIQGLEISLPSYMNDSCAV